MRTSPLPPQPGQVVGLVPAWRPAPGAGVAAPEGAELDLLLDAPDRLLEGQAQVVAQVRADGWPTPTAGSRRTLAEERVEEVAEALEAPEGPEALGPGTHARAPEGVVGLAALGIGEDLVGLVDLLEALVGARFRVDVGVPLLGELAEGLLDVGVARAARHAEDVVVVALAGHALGSIGTSRDTPDDGPRRPWPASPRTIRACPSPDP